MVWAQWILFVLYVLNIALSLVYASRQWNGETIVPKRQSYTFHLVCNINIMFILAKAGAFSMIFA